jgi:small conductance mechanosensitive channel
LFLPMNTNEVTANVAAQVPGTNAVTMNMLAQAAGINNVASTNAPSSMGYIQEFWTKAPHALGISPQIVHVGIVIVLAVAAHVLVRFVRYFSEALIKKSHEKKNPLGFVTEQPKFVTLSRLVISVMVFLIYAAAIYIIVTLAYPNDNTFKTYLTSAAVLGLALSFGLQGLVQDIVTGITIILSDTMDVGDTVDLMGGVIGRVERIGLRFVKIINVFNQEIYVPNRNVGTISRFPHGGIHAFVDVQIPAKADQSAVVQAIQTVANGVQSQFSAIIFDEPAFGNVQTTPGNWNYLRVRFRIWPGQNSIIENIFAQQTAAAMKTFDPNYAPWQIVVTYRAMNI